MHVIRRSNRELVIKMKILIKWFKNNFVIKNMYYALRYFIDNFAKLNNAGYLKLVSNFCLKRCKKIKIYRIYFI